MNVKNKALLMFTCLVIAACGNDEQSEQTLTDETVAKATVRLAEVTTSKLESWLFAEGTARASKREFLSFENAGKIEYVDPELKEGDRVSKGQEIAHQQKNRAVAELTGAESQLVDAKAQYTIAEAALTEAEANLKLAENTFSRYQTLIDQGSASQQEFDEASARLEQSRAALVRAERQLPAATALISAAEASLDQTQVLLGEATIISPMDGILARLNIEQGYQFSPQQVQATSETNALSTVPVVIIDPGTFEITVNLPAYEYRQIETGRLALIKTDQVNGLNPSLSSNNNRNASRDPKDYPVQGQVYSVSPSVDPATRTFSVRIRTTAGEELLQDGEFVTAWIAGPAVENAITIPLNANRYQDGQPYVFVYDPSSEKVRRQDLELGLQGTDRIQIVSGLSAGMMIVTDGRSGIADGDKVKIVNSASDGTQAK